MFGMNKVELSQYLFARSAAEKVEREVAAGRGAQIVPFAKRMSDISDAFSELNKLDGSDRSAAVNAIAKLGGRCLLALMGAGNE